MGQRIGSGSFERPNREQSKEDLRNRFFDAVNRYARHVLYELFDEPFRLYLEAGLGYNTDAFTGELDADERARKIAHGWNRHLWNHPEWQAKFEAGPISYDARKEDFRQSLFEWSRRNKLDAAWCREYAFETLDYWSYSQPDREQLLFCPHVKAVTFFPMGGGAKGLRRKFTFEHVVIHPQIKPLEETEAEMREAFDRQVTALILDLKKRAKASNYAETPKTYKSKYRKDYYRWLVEWAINGKPIQVIANESKDPKDKGERSDKGGPDNKTVRDAVNRLAEDIELPISQA
jgi:hypothetical protein